MTFRTIFQHSVLFHAALVCCAAQNLALDSASTTPGGSVSLALRLSGSAGPAALQWTLAYLPLDFTALVVEAGPAASTAGKTVTCHPAAGQITCVAHGINATGITDGVVATVTATTSAHVSPRTVSLAGSAASPAGQLLSVAASGGVVTTVPPQLSSLTCGTNTLKAGETTACTVTLTYGALAGGAVVTLSTDTALLQAPASVTVPAGQLTTQFQISAGAVTVNQSAALTAALGSTRSVAFSLTPPPVMCPCSLWSATDRPVVMTSPDTAAVELGVKFRPAVPGFILGVRFYKSPENTGTHSGRLWTLAGQQLASVTFRNETPSGWQQANFPTPIPVAANTTYVISYRAPRGRYSADAWYFSAGPQVNGPLTALQSSVENGNGVYRYGSIGFPVHTWNAANYWVDVVFNTVPSFAASPATTSSAPLPLVSRFRPEELEPEQQTPAAAELSVPAHVAVEVGQPLRFVAAKSEREGAPNLVSVIEMPKGAHYDPYSGWFEWIPAEGQEGDARIVFRTKGRSGEAKDAETRVTVLRRGETPPEVQPDACPAGREGEAEEESGCASEPDGG